MRSNLKVLFLLLLVVSLLTPGCTGKTQPEITNTITAVPEGPFMQEFEQGIEEHINARAVFDDAITLWNEGDYDNASVQLTEAKVRFSLASGYYHNMGIYASNDTERAFADNMEGSVEDLDVATDMFLMCLNESMYENDTNALAYFNEGQALVDDSMEKINRSIELMPTLFE